MRVSCVHITNYSTGTGLLRRWQAKPEARALRTFRSALEGMRKHYTKITVVAKEHSVRSLRRCSRPLSVRVQLASALDIDLDIAWRIL